MLTPTKMAELSNGDTINSMYTELNNKLTKEIISRIDKLGDLSKYSKTEIKSIINKEKKSLLKTALKETRKLYRKSKKETKSIYKEMSDALNDNK